MFDYSSLSSSSSHNHHRHHKHSSSSNHQDATFVFAVASLFIFTICVALYSRFIHPSSSINNSGKSATSRRAPASSEINDGSNNYNNDDDNGTNESSTFDSRSPSPINNNQQNGETTDENLDENSAAGNPTTLTFAKFDSSSSPIRSTSTDAFLMKANLMNNNDEQQEDIMSSAQQAGGVTTSATTFPNAPTPATTRQSSASLARGGQSNASEMTLFLRKMGIYSSSSNKNGDDEQISFWKLLWWIVKSFCRLIVIVFVKRPLEYGLVFVASSVFGVWSLFQLDDIVFSTLFSFAMFWCLNFVARDDNNNNNSNNNNSANPLLTSKNMKRRAKIRVLIIWMSFVFGTSSSFILDTFVQRPSSLLDVNALYHHYSHHHDGDNENFCNSILSSKRHSSLVSLMHNNNNNNNQITMMCLPSTALFSKHGSLTGQYLNDDQGITLCEDSSIVLSGESFQIERLDIKNLQRQQKEIISSSAVSSVVMMKVIGSENEIESVSLACRNNHDAPCVAISESALDSMHVHNLSLILKSSNDDDEKDETAASIITTRLTVNSKFALLSEDEDKLRKRKRQQKQNGNMKPSSSSSPSKPYLSKFSFLFGLGDANTGENEDEEEKKRKEEEERKMNTDQLLGPHESDDEETKLLKSYFSFRVSSSYSSSNRSLNNNIIIKNISSYIRIIRDEKEIQNDLWPCASYPKRLALILPVGLGVIRRGLQTMFPILTTIFNEILIPGFRVTTETLSEVTANIGCGILDVHAHHRTTTKMNRESSDSISSTGVTLTNETNIVASVLPLPPQDQSRIITIVGSRAVLCLGRSSSSSSTKEAEEEMDENEKKEEPEEVPDDENQQQTDDENEKREKLLKQQQQALNNKKKKASSPISVAYLSPLRTVFRELSIAVSWFASSVGWRVFVWCWNQELSIVVFIVSTSFGYFVLPISNFLLFDLIVDTLFPIAKSFIESDGRVLFSSILLPAIQLLFDWTLASLSFVGSYYLSYVTWARDMEMMIYGFLWEPLRNVLTFFISTFFDYLGSFLRATLSVSFKIHFLLSGAQTALLIFSVWNAFKQRQARTEERQRVKREREENRRSASSSLSPGSRSALALQQDGQSSSITNSIVNSMTGLFKTATRTSHEILVQGNLSKISSQVSTMLSLQRWYDQVSTVLSANLWRHCLTFAGIVLLIFILRFVPLPIGMINFILETYAFPIYTTMSFSKTFELEVEQNQEKNLLLLIDEAEEEKKELILLEHTLMNSTTASSSNVRRKEILQSRKRERQQNYDDIEQLLIEEGEANFIKRRNLAWLIDQDTSAVVTRLGIRMLIGTVLEYLFGGILDRIITELMNLVYLVLFVAFVCIVIKFHQFWSFAKNLFGGASNKNNNSNRRATQDEPSRERQEPVATAEENNDKDDQ